MPGESSIFEGEWWWTKWPMSSIPFPPDPRPQDPSIFRDLEAALQPHENGPHEEFFTNYQEGRNLASYPERLWKISRGDAELEISFGIPIPMYQFDLLRAYDLSLITHKLHHLQAQLESRPSMSYQTSQELTKLLQDQGII